MQAFVADVLGTLGSANGMARYVAIARTKRASLHRFSVDDLLALSEGTSRPSIQSEEEILKLTEGSSRPEEAAKMLRQP